MFVSNILADAMGCYGFFKQLSILCESFQMYFNLPKIFRNSLFNASDFSANGYVIGGLPASLWWVAFDQRICRGPIGDQNSSFGCKTTMKSMVKMEHPSPTLT